MGEVAWVTDVKAALERGRESYKSAAKLIKAAMKAHNLKQKDVAKKLGRSETWVCRLLQWFHAGCSEQTVFGGEISRRRKIAASQSERFWPTKSEMGQTRFAFGDTPGRNYRRGEPEATERARAVEAACHQLTRHIKNLKPSQVGLVLASSPNARRESQLEKLATRLDKAIRAAQRLAKALRKESLRVAQSSSPLPPKQTSAEQRIH